MKGHLRSSSVAVPTLTVLAATLLASCSHLPGSQRRVCVDARQNVIAELECRRAGGIGRYYYYNGGGGGIGSHISGGSFTSHSSGSSSRSASHVGRGGFGGHSSGG